MFWWEIKSKVANTVSAFELSLQEVPVIIVTCFVLHNWCEEHNVGIDDAAVIDQIQRDREMLPSRTNDRRYTFTSSGGRKIRDIIKDYFSEQSF